MNILASHGERPRGSLYLLAKNTAMSSNGHGEMAQSSAEDVLYGTGNAIDGLELEEMRGGRVRVLSNKSSSSGIFAGLRLNKGDCIFSIDGTPVSSIDEVREALREALFKMNHNLVPILTYNVFRRLKTTVMTAMCSNAFMGDRQQVGKPVDIEDMYNVQEKVSVCTN